MAHQGKVRPVHQGTRVGIPAHHKLPLVRMLSPWEFLGGPRRASLVPLANWGSCVHGPDLKDDSNVR